jgi:2-succinyl-5-enolpyruvyl-6-hydroxy-3-cyclohexene-1-carboxylate synthase
VQRAWRQGREPKPFPDPPQKALIVERFPSIQQDVIENEDAKELFVTGQVSRHVRSTHGEGPTSATIAAAAITRITSQQGRKADRLRHRVEVSQLDGDMMIRFGSARLGKELNNDLVRVGTFGRTLV